MQFSILATLLLATLSLASPAPKKEEKGFQVVIHYVDAPDCDVTCGANTTSLSSSSTSTESTTTITSTNTKYVIVTLQTGYGTTETLGYETATTEPSDYVASSTAAPVPTY
ncbi:hypothetical protein ABW19_dt0203492 [Dactylella cylindrospora]|nr:hypothetical protein ABW19_dt0203492 [Dactylella cylindrospora]